jgi:DnaK suppressor protein
MSEPEPTIDLDRARERLREERERIENALADLERVTAGEKEDIVDVETAPEDDGEMIEDTAVDSALAAQLRAELEALERAEKRLEEGTYGLSVESGEPIPAERLEAVPWAERTAEEQERFERTRGRTL